MKKFEGMLICTDLDGTLLRRDKTVSKENLEAIEHFKAEGGYFTFITGRMPYYVDDLPERVRINAPFGCTNGAGLYDVEKQEYVWRQPIADNVIDLVRYVDERIEDIGIQICFFDRICFLRENHATDRFREIVHVPRLLCDYSDVCEPFGKVVLVDGREERLTMAKSLIENHPLYADFEYTRSERSLYEILPKGTSKGSVLPRLAEHLGIDMSRTIAVGDYDNDVSMLKAAGLGIAVSNATDAARAAADIITVSNEEHAIAKIISDIESGKIVI